MSGISVDQHFLSGWSGRTTGTGYATINNGVLTVGTHAINDTGAYDYYVGVRGGTRIKCSIWARKKHGVANPRIAIDLFKRYDDYKLLNYCEVDDSGEWRLYTVEGTVPNGSPFPSFRLVLGSWLTQDASGCDFKEPTIELIDDYGSARMLSCGLVRMTDGVPSLHEDFKNLRILSMTPASDYLDIMVDVPLQTETTRDLPFYPIVTATTDNSKPITVHAGNVVPQSGGTRVRFKFSQGGSFQTLSSITGTFYFFFKVEW